MTLSTCTPLSSISTPGECQVPPLRPNLLTHFPIFQLSRATDAYNFYTTGQSKIQQGFLKVRTDKFAHNIHYSCIHIYRLVLQDGYELISEALNLLNNVYGAMHPEIAQVELFALLESDFVSWCESVLKS